MLNVTIDYSQITGARALFQKYPERMKKHLLSAMKQSLFEVTKELKDRVPVKTGTLRRSWNPQLPKANEQGGYDGKVSTNLSYAAFQEFGFHGAEQVKAHERHQCFGRETRPFTVPAHQRRVDYIGRPYARPGLLAAQPAIQEHHNREVRAALKEDANV